MIDRLMDDIPLEVPVVVVGPDPLVERPVTVTREDPAGGGPACAIGAALPHVGTELAAVLAADMPFGAVEVDGLIAAIGGKDGVVPVAAGHRQPLNAVYRTQALRGVRYEPGMSMRAVLSGLDLVEFAAPAGRFIDIDTPADLEAVERRLSIMEQPMKGLDMQQWVDAVKQALELDADVDVELILDVAKDAAHGVQRPAAPVTTYLLGLAVASGADPASAAAKIGELAQGWQPTADA
jgi:molybdopterin-guanine dinucleotide biosynthesis protein A